MVHTFKQVRSMWLRLLLLMTCAAGCAQAEPITAPQPLFCPLLPWAALRQPAKPPLWTAMPSRVVKRDAPTSAPRPTHPRSTAVIPLPRKPPTAGAPQSVPVESARTAAVAAAPGAEAVLFEDVGKRYCVGSISCLKHCADPASECEVRNVYVVRLDQPATIAHIKLSAQDNVDKTSLASLVVRVDGVPLDNVPVFQPGATLDVAVNRTAQIITVEATPPLEGVGLVGAVISDLYVLGRTTP